MAKKARTSTKQKPLTTMEDEFDVPEAVQSAADALKKKSVAKSRAHTAWKGAKDALIEAMREAGIERGDEDDDE